MGSANYRWEIRILLLILLLAVFAKLWTVQSNVVKSFMPFAIDDVSNINVADIAYAPPGDCPPLRSDYNVTFIPHHHMSRGKGDIYSGMWWLSIDTMLDVYYTRSGNLEGITFETYKRAEEVLSPVNWLDMSVEHLSKYGKHFDVPFKHDGADAAIKGRVIKLLEDYIHGNSKKTCHPSASEVMGSSYQSSAIQSTIAILPLIVSKEDPRNYGARRNTLQTAATIASLWNIGFQRVVVIGVSKNEKTAFLDIQQMLSEHMKLRHMELEFVEINKEELPVPRRGDVNVPRGAVIRFQKAVREYRKMEEEGSFSEDGPNQDMTMVTSWLGAKPSRWHNVYFSEPDLILHLRPEAVPVLSEELRKGNLLAAHRLNPVPHMAQFRDIYENYKNVTPGIANRIETLLLPDMGQFAAVHELDEASGDVCCDQGRFFPSNVDDPDKPYAVEKKITAIPIGSIAAYPETELHIPIG
eukprot:CAMPEP_0183720148 /NCGR_PEP_ID=MMETSP0737-20130205/12850_1 /TAXON_ID=385413 /ORGANISM="Thalassiosira miniscula, Strain CCMP1093" /LENGTH=467 /DNA_ID=CAMNT_0025949969 /DNA_START=95 /DNA_END=1499 /DNA_ORIENTATION=+